MKKVNEVINTLRSIDVDGETMQYILEQVGMTDQMLRQLVMTKDSKKTKKLLREKKELQLC
jgi:ribosomal protein S6